MVRKAPRTAFYFIQSAMTGFIASAFLSRSRVSLTEAFEGLELCERKLSCTVLRGLDGSNPVRLLGYSLGIPEGEAQRQEFGSLYAPASNGWSFAPRIRSHKIAAGSPNVNGMFANRLKIFV